MLKTATCFVFLFVMTSHSMSAEAPLVRKDEIFSMIEGCRSNHTENEINEDPSLMLEVACESQCMEANLNRWFKVDPANAKKYFDSTDVYEVEAAAGLSECRTGEDLYEETGCLAQWAPDIVEKLGEPSCGFHIECDVRFDIDENGFPTNMTAVCPDGVAQAELERESMCIVEQARFPSIRGRKNVVQPIVMASSDLCGNS